LPIILKSRDEISVMREAGQILAETLEVVVARVRPGLVEKELDEVARREFKKRGVTPTFLNYGQPPYPATICVSVNDEIVHGIPGEREIKDGDVVSIDIGCTYKGFVADMAVTVAAGDVAPEAQRLIEVTRDALWRGIGAARGGARAWVVAPGPNSSAILANRLLKEGAEVSWLAEMTPVGSRGWSYPAGSLYVRNVAADKMRALVTGLGLGGEEATRSDESALRGKTARLRAPRVGLYQPWTASMDEGWTRWLLEQYEFSYATLHNADLKAGKLGEKFDVIIFPGDRDKKDIVEGNTRKWTPEQYKGGIGEEGLKALEQFVRGGGTLVLLDESAELALESWAVPVKNALKGVKSEDFACPGSLLKILVDTNHPVAYGMRPESSAMFGGSPAFDLAPGFSYTDVKVIARYPATNPLQSGWIRGDEYLQNRIAAAEVGYDKGRIILIGFRAQFRAQPHNTFKLLFNALHYAAAAKP